MYRRDSANWLKHIDFVVLDLLCLKLAYELSFVITGHQMEAYGSMLNRSVALLLMATDAVLLLTQNTLKNVLKHGFYKNLLLTLKHSFVLGAVALCALFAVQRGQNYSRLAFFTMLLLYIFISYIVRELWKYHLKKKLGTDGGRSSMLLVADEDAAERVVREFEKNNYGRYYVRGLAILDRDLKGQTIGGLPVVAGPSDIPDYVCRKWVDEVLIVASDTAPYPGELIEQLSETGVTVHMKLAKVVSASGKRQFVEKVGGYTVLTTSINYAGTMDLVLKRMMDILGGLVGCFITLVLCIFVAPAILIASPGPIFFTQERVGRNGKIFKMYKFRSMYPDAEARKAALMKENKCSDARMFKMDFDPRVIGNRVMPDGSHRTGIGEFIRKTSIDEFPQFFNVLKGDMSIVGTRPPLISETARYELHHYARLAIKPGITGMWQVSGRSNITDFEEVVRLDKEYIENWSIGLDLKILLKTVLVVLRKEGSV